MNRTPVVAALAVLLAAPLLSAGDGREHVADRPAPLVLGHRGATGYLPEHTLASYALAIEQGADFIEPDLVSTKDGVLVARHEVDITGTTDVADHPEFASRRTTKTIDGITSTGWFADDFTLAEIRTLRAVQRLGFRPQQYNGLYKIPTFAEVIELAQAARRAKGRVVGVYPETKHPTYHQSVGLPLERKVVSVLQRYGWNHRSAPVFIQSFEVANLKFLNRLTSVRLVQLIDANDVRLDGSIDSDGYGPYDFVAAGDRRTYADLVTPAGLAEIATYADGLGPWKRYIIGGRATDANRDGQADDVNGDGAVDDADRTATPPTSLLADAHAAGLFVHAYTWRNEARYLLADYGDDPVQEYIHFYCLGVDGVFSDNPDTAITARTLFQFTPAACRSAVR
ncbi:MAG: glycerophosphodiester phosphodiesterase [Microthrixaceae bacterium]